MASAVRRFAVSWAIVAWVLLSASASSAAGVANQTIARDVGVATGDRPMGFINVPSAGHAVIAATRSVMIAVAVIAVLCVALCAAALYGREDDVHAGRSRH